MGMRRVFGWSCAVLALALAGPAAHGKAAPLSWADVREPAQGPARSIGSYSGGCVQGAEELPLVGAGYRVMKPERRRMYGHPKLIEFVRELASKIEQNELEPLGVGDLGQARGGPAPNGHASHQNGLDVDLWFSPAPAQTASSHSMVEGNKTRRYFSDRVQKLLGFAVADSRVDRIFVNPVIKQALCEANPATNRAWLRKVRPWWGHDEHFHVRLACPEGSDACSPQPPLPAGDGCAEVAWWLSEQSAEERAKKATTYQKRVGAKPELPAACGALLKGRAPAEPSSN
jgi:penicillin-insensitive murein endopeptidase